MHPPLRRRLRQHWPVLVPLALPWTVVTWPVVTWSPPTWPPLTWPSGWYVVFALGWVDPGGRVVFLPTYLTMAAPGLGPRSYLLTWPLATGLYLLAVLGSLSLPRSRRVATILGSGLFLSGLLVGFYGWGISGQGGILAVPVGTPVLWVAARVTYSRMRPGEGEE
ncbi:MAG: hypothetical protein ABEI31_00465 [Halodesulfurarchaeum sp.]